MSRQARVCAGVQTVTMPCDSRVGLRPGVTRSDGQATLLAADARGVDRVAISVDGQMIATASVTR